MAMSCRKCLLETKAINSTIKLANDETPRPNSMPANPGSSALFYYSYLFLFYSIIIIIATTTTAKGD